jgi:hypothetical protein
VCEKIVFVLLIGMDITMKIIASENDICDHSTISRREPLTNDNKQKAEVILFW